MEIYSQPRPNPSNTNENGGVKLMNNVKGDSMDKLQQLKQAVTLLEGQDIPAIKQALSLIGEAPEGINAPSNTYLAGSKIKIAILQRGWVFIGEFSQNGDACVLSQANTIRNWGTTKGLGELAENGPTSSTKLDPCPNVRFHQLSVVAIIDAKEEVWASKLR